MKVLTTIDLLALPSLETPPAGHVGFGAKSDGLYQKVGTVETKLSIDGHTHTKSQITDFPTSMPASDVYAWAKAATKPSYTYTEVGAAAASHTHTIAQITGLQGALDSKATPSDITTAINGIEIGGRNLALNTATNIVAIGIGQVNQVLYNGYNALDFVEQGIKTDDFVTITYYWKVRSLDSNDIYGNIYLRPRSLLLDNSISFGYYNTPCQYFSNDVTSGYTSETFQVGNVRQITDFWFRLEAPTNVEITIYKLKLEKGNKATDWTPAPEDQVSDWSVTDVNSFAFIKNKPTLLSQFTDNIGVGSHIANKANPHNVTKAQVGLGNVDNTADSAKNVLSATKLTTPRTIAGVSFDGTANIAIPFANLSSKPTTLAGYGITDGALKSLTLTAGNGLTGGGTLEANRTFALGTPSTLTAASTNAVTSTSHTHAITTTTVGAANTIVATDASGGVRGNIIRIGANWTLELSGTELVFKYNGVIKQRMLSDGTILATGEVTAFGTTS